jgi:hypothetical protein
MTGLKFSQRKDGTLEVRGLGIPFGGPINGKDLHGQFFSAKTDFAWDLIPDGSRPLLYQHGLDETVKTEVVGRWGVEKVDAKGVWVRAQLSARSSYLSEIKELLTEDALGLSSATMGHLVKVNQKNGEILNWPVVELSLTPNPANPTAYVVKSMATPARHAAKLLRVLKHGDHDQADHGNRDGAGSDGSEREVRGSVPSNNNRLPSDNKPKRERTIGGTPRVDRDRATMYIGRAREALSSISPRDEDDHSARLDMIDKHARDGAWGQVERLAMSAFADAEDSGYSDLANIYDDLQSMAIFARDKSESSKSLKHGDHDQADHGNRDGASGGGSDSGDKPSGGSDRSSGSPKPERYVRIQEAHGNAVMSIRDSADKLTDVSINLEAEISDKAADQIFSIQDKLRAASDSLSSKDVEKASSAFREATQILIDLDSEITDKDFDNIVGVIDEAKGFLRNFVDDEDQQAVEDYMKTKSRSRKHGDHDQGDHGNRDGAGDGGSDRSERPSISREPKLPASTGPKVTERGNGNRSLPWRGRIFHPSGYPRAAMSEAREYAKESLAKVQEHIKPIDPEDPDDIKAVADFKAAYEKNITEGLSLLRQGNVGGGLAEFARASARASRNSEPKELTDALDLLYDRTAASFGLDDVVNPDNLGRFKDIRERARAHFRDLVKNPGRGRRSWKADFLIEDAEEGAPEEEANEESDTLEQSIAKLVESTEYTLGEIAEALAKATDENNEVIVNCLTESQDALEKLAGELATYLEGTSPTDEVEDETETETPIASPMASLAVLAGKPSRAEGNLAAVKAALSAEIRKQTLVAIGRTRDRK